jgi:hypothetical protein
MEGEMNWMTMLFAAGALVSAEAQSELSRDKKMTEQVVREGSFELDTSADRALLLFTPEGERAWVKGWEPKPMYPAQADVAFETNARGKRSNANKEIRT